MIDLTPSSISERLAWRYAVKKFDAKRRISEDIWVVIEESLVLAPSSFGLQPWRFVVVTDSALKEKLPAISWNQAQPRDCSHFVILAARKKIDEAYVGHFIDSVANTRKVPAESLNGYRAVIMNSVKQSSNHLHWNSQQVYIALGQLMLAAAMLGVDSCPMEGIDTAAYDRMFELDTSDYATVVACALGYRSSDDKYAHSPKIRFPKSEIIHTH